MKIEFYAKANASIKEALESAGFAYGDANGYAESGAIPFFKAPLEKAMPQGSEFIVYALTGTRRESADGGEPACIVTYEIDFATPKRSHSQSAIATCDRIEEAMRIAGWHVSLASFERDQEIKRTVAIYDCSKVMS